MPSQLVNHTTVQVGLIRFIRDKVGYHLADLPTNDPLNPTKKAVLKDRSQAPQEEFPYIIVERIRSDKEKGSWVINEYVTELDQPAYTIEHNITLRVTAYGEGSDNILTELRMHTLDDFNRVELNNLTKATHQIFTDIEENPIFLDTDFVESATMDAIFIARSEWVNEAGSTIETVSYEGKFVNAGTGEIIYTDIVPQPTPITP